MEKFASAQDYELCRRIQKKFGTTYYFATRRFPSEIRRRTYAVYAFVRVPDEWVDNPGSMPPDERLRLIADWRSQFYEGLAGKRPEHFAMRAFVDAVRECGIPTYEADVFLDAMAMDVTKSRYATYEELREYMRGSASAVGVMMCYAMDAKPSQATLARAHALGEAMQLTNFLRDVAEDVDRGRIYLPLEDLATHGIPERDILEKRFTPAFRELMRFEICRAKKLYFASDMGLPHLPSNMQKAVMLARLLYAKILDKIVEQDYDVFQGRTRTSLVEKLSCAARVMTRSEQILGELTATAQGRYGHFAR